MVEGELERVERPARRSHAFIGGSFQEIETLRTDEYRSLGSDQVLLIKDFILEDRSDAGRPSARAVDVPSPVAGYVSRRDDRNAMVEISDGEGGNVVARVRHVSDIGVSVGDRISYGQRLGEQSNLGLGLPPGRSVHVHLEMDTRYYQHFENYISDLASGRLPVQARHREGVQPQPVIDDGTFRLGESDRRIRDLQQVMQREGYHASDGRALDLDGVYRPGMQGALLDFQRDHGVPQTGDVDPATLQFAPTPRPREADRQDYPVMGRPMPPPAPEPERAQGHPDHPDHRQNLPEAPEPAVNQRRAQAFSFSNPHLDELMAAFSADDAGTIAKALADIARSPQGQAWLQKGQDQLAARETLDGQRQEATLQVQASVISRG